MDFIFVGAGNFWNYIKQDWKSNRVRFCTEVFAWACWTRRSFGLMANSVFLVTIDSIGLIRFAVN